MRIWHEYWRNYTDLADTSDTLVAQDNLNLFKIKTSLWGKADLNEEASLYAKMSNENAAYTYFGGISVVNPDKQPAKKGYHYDINEVFF